MIVQEKRMLCPTTYAAFGSWASLHVLPLAHGHHSFFLDNDEDASNEEGASTIDNNNEFFSSPILDYVALYYIHLMPYIWSTIIVDNHNEAQQAICARKSTHSAAAATTIVIASVICATLAYFTKVNQVAHCCAAIIA